MKLENELQIHVQQQQMKNAYHVSADLPPQRSLHSSISNSSPWVKLIHPPAEYCQDEALLLCQTSDARWVAWIPDYGKILLSAEDFSL